MQGIWMVCYLTLMNICKWGSPPKKDKNTKMETKATSKIFSREKDLKSTFPQNCDKCRWPWPSSLQFLFKVLYFHLYFVIFRQAGPGQLKAGLMGGLCKQWQGQTTTPGVMFPTLCEKFVGSFRSPASQYREEARDGLQLIFLIRGRL